MNMPSLSKPGSLIRSRNREWVVLPGSTDEMIMAKPVGGLDEEITGLLPAVEPVESASFPLPSKNDVGDFSSGRLLRDAARLSKNTKNRDSDRLLWTCRPGKKGK